MNTLDLTCPQAFCHDAVNGINDAESLFAAYSWVGILDASDQARDVRRVSESHGKIEPNASKSSRESSDKWRHAEVEEWVRSTP